MVYVPSVAQDLLDASLRSKLGLARYESWVAGRVNGLLNSANADLERRISIALERSAPLDTTARLQAIRKELAAANAEAYGRVNSFLTDEMQSLAVEQSEALASSLESILPFKFSASRPSAELLHSLVTQDPLHGRLLGATSADGVNSIIDNLAGNRAAALMEQIQQGVVQSESWGSILKRIRGTASGNYQDGVLSTIGNRQAEVVARTAVQHFTEAARDELIQANADLFQGVMWVATLDLRTCPLCIVRDGKVWDLDYRPVGHTLTWAGGPGRIHFQDRCTSIPVLKETQTLQRAGIVPERIAPGERAALDNPVPVTTDFGEWLGTQDLSLQEQVLGKAGAADFNDGTSLEEVFHMRLDRLAPEAPDRLSRPTLLSVTEETPVPEVVHGESFVEPTDSRDPHDLEAVNPVDNPEKLARLVQSMEESGWQGQPVLIVNGDTWTASHRIEAARRAGLSEIPVYEIEIDRDLLADFGVISDDADRLAALESIEDIDAGALAIMRAEVAKNERGW